MAAPFDAPYIQTTSNATQLITALNTPQTLHLDTVEESFQMSMAADSIKIEKDGQYVYIVAPQIGRVGEGLTYVPTAKIWVAKNASIVPNSAVLVAVNRYRTTKLPVICQGVITLLKDDVVSFKISADVANEIRVEAYPAASGAPAVPSMIVTMYRINKETEGL